MMRYTRVSSRFRLCETLLLATCLLAGGGCWPWGDAPPRLDRDTSALERDLARQGLSLLAIGNLSNELGERYEDAGRTEQAARYYSDALWAYEHHAHLTGDYPLLLDDVRESIKRLGVEVASSDTATDE